jgi:hypothetical protein
MIMIIDKHFPPGHPLAKIMNRNTVKISYKCMPNMKMAVAGHNLQVQKDGQEVQNLGCNCSGMYSTHFLKYTTKHNMY